MPLRDHFNPPLDDQTSWDGLFGQWPAALVAGLNRNLPPEYVALPRIHLSLSSETDVVAPEQDEYEVRVFSVRPERCLVAVIELVSPANKDCPGNRRAFTAKCAALVRTGVSVAIVDAVTALRFNLYGELLDLLGQGHSDRLLFPDRPSIYAVAFRWRRAEDGGRFEAWTHALALGKPLPILPLWVAEDIAFPLDLEESYESACRDLRID